jgi:3'-5' exoribonuclease
MYGGIVKRWMRLKLRIWVNIMVEGKKVSEFEKDDEVQGFFLVKSSVVKVSNSGKKYLDLTICDNSGDINSKIWEIQDLDVDDFKSGAVVKIRGNVLLWQNSLQLKISRIRKAEEGDEYDIPSLVTSAPIDEKDMMEEILSYARSIENESIRSIVNHFMDEYREKLMYYPAAKRNHHSIRSGLLYHILRMLRLGEKLLDVYSGLSSDMLYAGIILHDIEKINEMDSNDFGFVSEYSKEGQLLGHIIMGITKIGEVGKLHGADEEVVLALQHMILSHHYEPEYGSPKKPMIPEAEILHYLDIIDARVYDMQKTLQNVDKGGFSEPIFSMERRIMYKVLF